MTKPSKRKTPIQAALDYRGLIGKNPSLAIPIYLSASYAYYVMDEVFLTDALFDEICKVMVKNWDELDHRHKHLLDPDTLKAGSCLLGPDEYPAMAQGAAIETLKRARVSGPAG